MDTPTRTVDAVTMTAVTGALLVMAGVWFGALSRGARGSTPPGGVRVHAPPTAVQGAPTPDAERAGPP